MKCITMTHELAMSAAKDAGNRSMRAAGRSIWSQADADAAYREYDRLIPPFQPEPLLSLMESVS